MILVREVFICKPGQASKFAKMMKEIMAESPDKMRIMTDMTGVFNKVVMETEFADLGAFEKRMQEYMQNPKPDPKMAGYTEMYAQGKREIYRLW